jgi:prepilin-type N-terminal cleavage/methylation domain-containing protein
MDSYSHKLAKRLHKNEDGFSLPELLIVMLIIGILLTLGIGAYLRAQRNAENTQVRDKVSTAYKTVLNCKTENDGFFGKFEDDIIGDFCLGSRIVNNNIRLCQINGPGSGADAACENNVSGGSCWDTRADGRDADGNAVASTEGDLQSSPSYDSSNDRIFNVGVCTFRRVASGASANDGASNADATSENSSDSQYIRLSAHRNGKAYYFVEDPGGFAACQAPVNDDGEATQKLRCQA